MLKGIDSRLDETVPARRPITVRDLLTSTFGYGLDITALGNSDHERDSQPGDRAQYA